MLDKKQDKDQEEKQDKKQKYTKPEGQSLGEVDDVTQVGGNYS